MAAPFLARRTTRRGPPARGNRRLPPPPPATTLILPAMILALALLACAPCIATGERGGGPPLPFGRRRSPPPKPFARSRPSSLPRSIVAGDHSPALSSATSLSRGGGFGDRLPLLGRRRRKKRRDGREKDGGGGGDDGDGDDEGRTLYPPLTRDEIEEKLNLPAYCVTDAEGSGIAVMGQRGGAGGGAASDGSGGGCVYLFLSRAMADEALRLAKEANGHLEGLKVSALHLGKVWFRLLHNENISVSMKPGNGPEISRKVRFRLVPGARDLVASRVMLGLNAEEAQALRVALEPSPAAGGGDDGDGRLVPSDIDGARSIIERAARNSPAFKTPFDEVPVFLMPRMRVSRPEDGEGQDVGGASRSAPKLPLFLSSKNMVKTFLDMAKENPEILSSVATAPGFGLGGGGSGGFGGGGNEGPVVQLVELNRIVEMMQEESEMDFRNVVILPPVEDDEDGNKLNEEDDSEDDDDDDGDGGDFGVSADYGHNYDEAEFSPFVSMEVSVLGEGQELVPMH